MPFMTAASLRNPRTLGRSLLDVGQDIKQKNQQDQIATVAREIQEGMSSLSQEQQMDATTVNNMVKEVFSRNPNLSPQAQQMGLKMAHDAQSRMMQSETFQQQREDREKRLGQERVEEADLSLLGRLQDFKPHGVEGDEMPPPGVEGLFGVPETKESLLGRLSYPGRMTFEQQQREKEKAAADIGLTKAKTKALGVPKKPTYTKRTLYKPDGSSIEVYSPGEYKSATDKGFTATKPVKGIGAKTMTPEQANKEYARVVGQIDKVKNSGGLDELLLASMDPEIRQLLMGADRTEYLNVLNSYASELKKKVSFPIEEAAPEGNITHTFVPGKGLVPTQ